MNKYDLNGWTILCHTELPLDASSAKEITQNTVYIYDAPLNATKMIQYMPLSFLKTGGVENLDLFLQEATEEPLVLSVNSTLFFHKYPHSDYKALIEHINDKQKATVQKKYLTLLGLGDVGSMLTIGLKLLGETCVSTIGIYDLSEKQQKRWEMELSQITVNPDIKIKAISKEELFDGDMFVFCASKAIPKVGEESQSSGEAVDVRMIQFEENSKIISIYAKMAREQNYKGIFAVVSDPVDLLCKTVYTASNQLEGTYDYKGLLPEQVVGFGLGVMDGRAKYYSEQLGLSYSTTGRAFGPHGKDLVVSDDVRSTQDETALKLTHQVITANLEMRALGYKPFIAPALSSGAHAIISMLTGEWHYSAQFLNGVYWGARNKRSRLGVQYEHLKLADNLKARLRTSYNKLEETWETLTS